ncbi:DNA repair-scaffolding protein isoform X2 [Corythoichthys intestinalis]|uniref:DNA repair-scaffolding protein isoform X2 n=1 Tax=Corythoichthys intestinalis TaxID=161448 RepID=UPI0025A6070F|nr:DNA repair-scaffolding protein isoform X2 [Corythoichthys intestinalis]
MSMDIKHAKFWLKDNLFSVNSSYECNVELQPPQHLNYQIKTNNNSQQRKWTKDLKCVYFPDDIERGVREVRKPSTLSSASSGRSWEKCGESFLDSSLMKDVKTTGRKLSFVRNLAHSPASDRRNEDPVDIAWSSSSDSEQSEKDDAQQQRHHRPLIEKRPPVTTQSYPKALHTLSSDEDDMAVIETDGSEQDIERDSDQQISDCESPSWDEELKEIPAEPIDLDISGFASDGEAGNLLTTGRLNSKNLQGSSDGGNKRSVSEWVRSAHAMLRTPKKPLDRQSKTPEDSAKKKRKFQTGGLAERLNRLHCRQRSAVSFWRHCSTSNNRTEIEDRPGVLVLEVLEVQEECGAQLVRCQHRLPPGHTNPLLRESAHVLVMLCRETAAQLGPQPADIIHISPPWQRLSIESLGCDIILNTHFSRKVKAASEVANVPPSVSVAKCLTPYPLCRTFGMLEICKDAKESNMEQVSPYDGASKRVLSSGLKAKQCHSLLEAIEGLGQAGSMDQDVRVVVQRVYSIPAPTASIASIRLPFRSSSIFPPAEQGKRRLCLLVQDSFGMFSVVQLHMLACWDDLGKYCRAWRGRICVLRGIKVVQRVTRERRSSLFSLIDSLWPPLKLPLECHGNAPSMASSRPPSFCYFLSGQENSVESVEEGPSESLLHLPSTRQMLQDILQIDHKTCCCSFFATVIYKRIQSSDIGQGEVWLVVTDQSLQDAFPNKLCRRTVALHVNASCGLNSHVLQALNDPAECCLSFTDVIKEHGVLQCVEHSIIDVMDSPVSHLMQEPPARPAKLDLLDVEVTPNSLCTFTGVIVGVDETTSYSWPVCNYCESDKLETIPLLGFHCGSCKSTVDKPVIQAQMEVFLSSASLQNCTIKVKFPSFSRPLGDCMRRARCSRNRKTRWCFSGEWQLTGPAWTNSTHPVKAAHVLGQVPFHCCSCLYEK